MIKQNENGSQYQMTETGISSVSYEEIEKIFRYISENFVYECASGPEPEYSEDMALSRYVRTPEETWQEMLVRLLNEKGMANPECYKKAGVDRKLFSKIMSDRQYTPKKNTAVKLALALELPIDSAKGMLEKAGYALSHSSRRDLAIEYFFLNKKYDLFELNYALHMLEEEQL